MQFRAVTWITSKAHISVKQKIELGRVNVSRVAFSCLCIGSMTECQFGIGGVLSI